MAINFPGALDDFPNPTPTTFQDELSHAQQHQWENDAIEALQAKVGINNSLVTSSIDYMLKNVSSVNPGHHHTPAAINLTQRCVIGRVTNTAGIAAEIFPASDLQIFRRDDGAATVFGFGTLNLANTGFFVNQLQSTQGGLGNGTWNTYSIPFYFGGAFAEFNTGDNQFLFNPNVPMLSIGSATSFGIGTVYSTFGASYSRGTIFADGAAVVPGASTADIDMTLYVTGAAACPNVSGNYAGAGLRYLTGAGANNSNADEGIPSEAGSFDFILADSGSATGENAGNGANAAHYSFTFGKAGTSDSSDPGNPGFFVINSSKASVLFNLIDSDSGVGFLTLNADVAQNGYLHVTNEILGNSSQANADCVFRSVGNADMLHVHASANTVTIGLNAAGSAILGVSGGSTSQVPFQIGTGNLKTGGVIVGALEFLAPFFYLTGNARQDIIQCSNGSYSNGALSAAVGATTIYAVPSSGGNRMYRVEFTAKVITPSSGGVPSSVLGGAGGIQVIYTDSQDSVVITTAALMNTAGVTLTLNSTQTLYTGYVDVWAKASTNIQFTCGYTSVGTNAMVYSLRGNCGAL